MQSCARDVVHDLVSMFNRGLVYVYITPLYYFLSPMALAQALSTSLDTIVAPPIFPSRCFSQNPRPTRHVQRTRMCTSGPTHLADNHLH